MLLAPVSLSSSLYFSFFFNDTATTEIYTLSLHDALPNYRLQECHDRIPALHAAPVLTLRQAIGSLSLALWDEQSRKLVDRKSTRLNSSHLGISYAVFCLKKKKKKKNIKQDTYDNH